VKKFLYAAIFLLTCSPLLAQDWPQFRGPGGLGVSSAKNLPAEWSDDKNLLWKTKLPGAGASSPILVGDKIYLTCWSGAVTKKTTAGLTRHLICLDKGGKKLWQKDLPAPAKDFPLKGFTALHGYASSTPVSDGKRLFVFFGAAGVFAFDLDGKQLWHTSVGTKINKWGTGASPVFFKNLVIINADIESAEILALDQDSGKKVWGHPVKLDESWGTPLLVQVGDKTELVVGVENQLVALDPLKGEPLWTCRGSFDYVCPTAVADQGIVYAVGGLTSVGAVAVKAGGRGDVTATHRLWSINKGSNVSSPIYHDGHLYWAHEENGVVYCVDAKTGKLVYQERLAPASGRIYASATLADGKLYYVSRTSGVYVLEAGPQFKLLAHNQFASDTSAFNASPAIAESRMYLRSDQSLYCVAIRK
jgi:outer membrane protein assembly factor BamB